MTRQLTRTQVQAITADIFKAMKEVEKKHDIKVSQDGNIGFSDIDFKLKLKVMIDDEDALMNKEKENFELYAEHHGFSPEGFNQVILVGGKQMRIVGYNPKARKYPIVAVEEGTDARYKLGLSTYTAKFPLN